MSEGVVDSAERLADFGGERSQCCGCAKRDERNEQGILDRILTFFPEDQVPHACQQQRIPDAC